MRYVPFEDHEHRPKAYRPPEMAGAPIVRPAGEDKVGKTPLILGGLSAALFAGAITLLAFELNGLRSTEKDPVQIVGTSPTTPQPGMMVLSADGEPVGTVESVDAIQDGRVTAVNVISDRFLGFGARLVAIPEGKFSVVNGIVRVEMTLAEIQRMPNQGP
jgi:hypothetical protein